jgi:hypothetical protein
MFIATPMSEHATSEQQESEEPEQLAIPSEEPELVIPSEGEQSNDDSDADLPLF